MWLGHRHRRTQAERLLLADVVHRGHVGDLAHELQVVELARLLQVVLELERAIEVVLERALAAPGDDEDVSDSGVDGLFDDVLDGRLVDQREHLFGL